MSYNLVVPTLMWDRVRSHLLSDSSEHLAFFLARQTGERFLVRETIIISDDDLEDGDRRLGISLKLPALLDVMNRANQNELVLIEAHSHPFTKGDVSFSDIDCDGQEELVSYLRDVSPGSSYGAIVVGQCAVQGSLWLAEFPSSIPIDRVQVLGPTIAVWNGDGRRKDEQALEQTAGTDSHHRQILALGELGQRAIKTLKIAVVGLGGIGSMVHQQLAHLGVGELILIDDDVVERTNLSRIVGASVEDVGNFKVDVAAALAESVNPDVNVSAIPSNVRDKDSMDAIKSADAIFGCVDTDSARMILNEFALAHLIPFIDCGVGINVEEGQITEAGGRVVSWIPGRPCLLCCNEIQPDVAAEELESLEQLEFRKQQGYVSGHNVPEPSVVALNGVVASLAVTEFLALVTGFRASGHYVYYDMLEQRVGPRIVKRNPKCVACVMEGIGDSANLARYSRVGIPSDIPVI